MGSRERRRGARGENEVVKHLRAHGWNDAERSHDGRTQDGPDGGDIRHGPEGVSIEIKYQERAAIWAWLEQAEHDAGPTRIPIVAFRRNNSAWYACLPLDELLALVRFREQA